MTVMPPAEGLLRITILDGEPSWRLQCPQCGHWGEIDEDQLHGRVSTDHTNCGVTYERSECECTFHETRDWYSTAKWCP